MGRWFVAGSRRGPAAGALSVHRLRVALLGVLALVAGACSGSSPSASPDTTAVAETTTTTVPPTTTTTVRATTTSTTLRPTTTVTTLLTMGPGNASIGGTVSGPAGPVDGAIVRVERLVGQAVAMAEVTTTGGGSWNMGSILGGSFRVRALRPPDFGQSTVEAFFLGANERKTVDLRMPAAGGERITATVNPNPPRVDQQATMTIQYGTGRVDDQGRTVVAPRPNIILTVAAGPGIVLESAPQALTDGNGLASWLIRCSAVGASTLTLTIANGVTQVTLPACVAGAPPAPPTTTRR